MVMVMRIYESLENGLHGGFLRHDHDEDEEDDDDDGDEEMSSQIKISPRQSKCYCERRFANDKQEE